MACHLPYLLPILGLALFWVIPWQTALPLYLVLVGVSAVYAWVTVRTFRQPVQTGCEAMVGLTGVVVRDGGPPVVRISDELWNARSKQPLVAGEEVRVIAVEGLRLRVEPAGQRR